MIVGVEGATGGDCVSGAYGGVVGAPELIVSLARMAGPALPGQSQYVSTLA